mmetsp:Transcript_26913/g.53765  ORF Transcript_26913/g.53765 Transcript_26913/m.53765 type:complete len:153 (-) Transcript_26913:256-714(-)|eukprot:CAMPEP_0194340116 /NCGR_PEP_ID=MMETSP0171-20130528/85280_1 /TAXON_ID=218684 /ORGANISM="Corethron pennatum, Strain L29A3" /LENGTH=152 /DNA_ID=CAMNT_0039104941 /DNA_START=95 /DNA_END=553 /DNA_ORIENTATION=+
MNRRLNPYLLLLCLVVGSVSVATAFRPTVHTSGGAIFGRVRSTDDFRATALSAFPKKKAASVGRAAPGRKAAPGKKVVGKKVVGKKIVGKKTGPGKKVAAQKKGADTEKVQMKVGPELILLFLNPLKNPNSLALYAFGLIYWLGKVKETRGW